MVGLWGCSPGVLGGGDGGEWKLGGEKVEQGEGLGAWTWGWHEHVPAPA